MNTKLVSHYENYTSYTIDVGSLSVGKDRDRFRHQRIR